MIRTQDADYFLKPLQPHQALLENFSAPSDHHPHILYKRSTPAQTNRGRNRRSTEPKTVSRRDSAIPYLWRSTQTDPTEYHRMPHSHDGTRQRQHFCGRRKKYMPKPPEDDIYIFPDEYKLMPRGKRAIMFKPQTHQRLNVETLVVSTLFKDGTIGGDINVVIVGLILLDEDQHSFGFQPDEGCVCGKAGQQTAEGLRYRYTCANDGLVINHHADHTLNSFCQWQSGLSGREGRRHDHAILLTGLDICSWKNEPCDTLGFAPISGMCSKYRSCTINEDTGLGLAFTIAHESGHNFGMVHDGEGNVCKKSVGNIMSPTLAGHNGLFSWSSCSRQYLNRFLRSVTVGLSGRRVSLPGVCQMLELLHLFPTARLPATLHVETEENGACSNLQDFKTESACKPQLFQDCHPSFLFPHPRHPKNSSTLQINTATWSPSAVLPSVSHSSSAASPTSPRACRHTACRSQDLQVAVLRSSVLPLHNPPLLSLIKQSLKRSLARAAVARLNLTRKLKEVTLGKLSGDEELNQIHLMLTFLPLQARCCRVDPSPDNWKQDLCALQKNRCLCLSTAQATCLSDEPSAIQEYKYPEKLPGELYDADTQCKWQFGEKAKLCTLDFKKATGATGTDLRRSRFNTQLQNLCWDLDRDRSGKQPSFPPICAPIYSHRSGFCHSSWQSSAGWSFITATASLMHPYQHVCLMCVTQDICKALWCHRVGRKCETKFMPAAEGSACGPEMMFSVFNECFQGGRAERGCCKCQRTEWDAFPLIQALHSRLGLMSSCGPRLTSWAASLLTHVAEVGLGHEGNNRPVLRSADQGGRALLLQTHSPRLWLIRRPALVVWMSFTRVPRGAALEWCRRGQCVKQGDEGPKPVHGQWSSWSGWSSCSRTCESGVTYRERHCSSPRPMYGGKFCTGSSRSYKLCNTGECPQNAVDFRAAQCAEFNSKPFRGWYYKWKPYTRVDDQDVCKLYCFAEGYDFFFALSSKVKDGTLCTQDGSDVCIDGICERVGCDRVLGSSAVPDLCGVCKGDNSTCKIYKGQYTKQHQMSQYYRVVTVPAGARSIRVMELNSSSSYLALRNLQRKYYLNGRWTVDWPGRHSIAGAVFDYKRPYNRPESLTSTGPTNETLVVEVLMQGWNPGIQWEYTLNKDHTERRNQPKHNYTWAIVRSQCSASCAGGQMVSKSVCYKDLRLQVNTSYCNSRSRPPTGVTSCNTQPCPAR
ncbi:A disintegrin and metalloproteinase with thrombospondin motifs 16 [Labeo rohita]|uniref:A disintegrin and metalloproteinase with thrombospondin motifs 16 n=1 Tax=Labeo rohita TaxID=84645 RepID=A0ABQ8LYX0_LABRO|nr:A disintegrin and metalloproteinase with thrombospondin motifs 16 [Labeo rohita]